MKAYLEYLVVSLRPWVALGPAVFVLGLVHVMTHQGTFTIATQRLIADGLMLLRAIPIWCVFLLPTLVLPSSGQAWLLGGLSSLFLILLLALDLYASVSGVPLGADLFAYSLEELGVTVRSAQIPIPWLGSFVTLATLILVWKVVLGRPAPTIRDGVLTAGILLLCVTGSIILPTQWPVEQGHRASLATNKLTFLSADLFDRARFGGAQMTGSFPFEHPETTPDTLGPLFNLDKNRPPHLVIFIVEGLGRSFSGPDARLGSFTPFLDSLIPQSLYWENFLAAQGRTFAVIPSVLGSLPFGPYGEQPIIHDSLPSLLKEQGFRLRYFSGSDLGFDHQGAILKAMGVEDFWSAPDYKPPARKLSEWGYPDGDLVDAALSKPWPNSPSITVVQTMSMHSPFVVPNASYWMHQVEKRIGTLNFNSDQRDATLRQQEIYSSILYTDDSLRRFFDQFSKHPAWKNTIVIITGDHRLPEIPMDTRIERYHVPLIITSPMLREVRRIKAVSSHFDITPSLLALLSHRYSWPMPQRVHWMGQGLDVSAQWRNLHDIALKQTKSELSDYISGEYYLAQGRLLSLRDGFVTEPEATPAIQKSMLRELSALRAAIEQLPKQGALVDGLTSRQHAVYSDAGRTLEPAHRARRVQGVVVTDAKGRFDAEQGLIVEGIFTQQGPEASAIFVPLLVLSDAQGRELAEVSGKSLSLKPGQSETIKLKLFPGQSVPGTYYFSLIVSNPDTGRPIGKGQYHVAVVR